MKGISDLKGQVHRVKMGVKGISDLKGRYIGFE